MEQSFICKECAMYLSTAFSCQSSRYLFKFVCSVNVIVVIMYGAPEGTWHGTKYS